MGRGGRRSWSIRVWRISSWRRSCTRISSRRPAARRGSGSRCGGTKATTMAITSSRASWRTICGITPASSRCDGFLNGARGTGATSRKSNSRSSGQGARGRGRRRRPCRTYTRDMDKLVPEHAEIIRRVAADLKGRPGPLLEVLHAIQAQLGHVPPAAVPLVAAELNLSRAEVHGVISFYHYFRSRPPGAHTVSVCRAESCQAVGAEALAAHARQRLGV